MTTTCFIGVVVSPKLVGLELPAAAAAAAAPADTSTSAAPAATSANDLRDLTITGSFRLHGRVQPSLGSRGNLWTLGERRGTAGRTRSTPAGNIRSPKLDVSQLAHSTLRRGRFRDSVVPPWFWLFHRRPTSILAG